MCGRTVLLGSAAFASCMAHDAHAQSRWQYQFDAALEAEHDSNPAMSVGNPVGVNLVRAVPELRARYRLDRDEYELMLGAALERSSRPEISANRNDPRLRADWRHATPRARYGAYALHDQRALRTVQVAERVPVAVDGTRKLSTLGGSISYDVAPADTVSADARRDWVRYDVASVPGYRLDDGGLQFTHEIDQRRSWYARASVQRYETDGAAGSARDSGSSGVLLGYRTLLYETLQADFGLGAVRLRGVLESTEWQGSARLVHTSPRAELSLEASRRTNPDPTAGGLGNVSTVLAAARHALDERTSVVVDVQRGRSRSIQSSTATSAALSWVRQLTPSWSLALKAQRRWRQDFAGRAHASVLGLGLNHSLPDF